MRRWKCTSVNKGNIRNFTVGKIYETDDNMLNYIMDNGNKIKWTPIIEDGDVELGLIFKELIEEEGKVKLEKEEEKKEMKNKFKMGDIVEVLNYKDGHSFKVGEILEVVNDDEQDSLGCKKGEMVQWFNSKNLKLVKRVKQSPSKTLTITTSDTTTTLTDGSHATSINRYYTDKNDEKVAVNEVVKKYYAELDEIKRESDVKHLRSSEGTDYGVVGNPTKLTDSIGIKLFVGDVVKVYDKSGNLISLSFVCNNERYGDFIMGSAYTTMNNSKEEVNYLKEMSYEDVLKDKSITFIGLVVK